MIYYVYQYLREDKTPYYIGKGKGNRAWYHGKKEVHPPRDKSRIEIIAYKLTEFESFVLERKLILLYGRKDIGTGILHNKTDGGEGPGNPSEITRRKISEANRGRITSEETKQKISNSKIGKKRELFSEEWKNNMSAIRQGKKRSPHTEETKLKLRIAQTGKRYSAETNKKKGRRQKNIDIQESEIL